jgi:regulator of G-protein signaling
MHASRRRKKRSNYGVRSVELARGRQGFGFTISGQQPCILSCIVPGSPAERAGLRAGDYLVSANGQGVGRTPHDEVVRLIGSARGTLRLQIAESYYSDSSDDEGAAAAQSPSRPKPKGKARTGTAQNRAAKVGRP